MSKPIFTYGATSIEFSRGLQYPLRKPADRLQVVSRSAAGTVARVEDLGVTIRSRELVFRNLPKTDWDDLCDFYDNVVFGAGLEFTYSDENGDEFTVRLMSNPWNMAETAYQKYSGTIELEVIE